MLLSELLLTMSLLVGIVEKKEAEIKEEIYTILIDPGHGGRDNGAAINSVLEDEINLSISNKLFEKCISQNYVCYIMSFGGVPNIKQISGDFFNILSNRYSNTILIISSIIKTITIQI